MSPYRRTGLLLASCSIVAVCLIVTASASASFGLQSLGVSVTEAPSAGAVPGTPGPPDMQAGSHPFQLTTSFSLDQRVNTEGKLVPDEAVKDVDIELPPGLVGNPSATPQCPRRLLAQSGLLASGEECPASTQIGTATLNTTLFKVTVPVFNLVPSPGLPAQFGFAILTPVVMDVSVRSGSDYGVTVSFRNLSESLPIEGASLTLWGVPGDPAHDALRGSCLEGDGTSNGNCSISGLSKSLLTMPTSCALPLKLRATADSWESPNTRAEKEVLVPVGEGTGGHLRGCGSLHFEPTIDVQPEERTAGLPTGLLVNVGIPQNESSTGLAEANLHAAAITLPKGVSINASAADGLAGCSASEFGLENSSVPQCPNASKIGGFEIETPLLMRPLLGSIYLGKPDSDPFDGRLTIYAAAEEDGIQAKLPARLVADQSTGQLALSLDTPELPFSDLRLHLFGGPRAVLANPSSCGMFTATTELTPYSAPGSGSPAEPSSTFEIGQNCESRFLPTLMAGATNPMAGADTDFALQLRRADNDQYVKSLSTTLPPGLIARLNAVPLCAESDAMAGTCSLDSRVASVLIAVGSGPSPFLLRGQAFLTGPYDGAPFGLSIVVPGLAGPFNLGTTVLRASISVDSTNAGLTISTGPLPQILGGVPLRIRTVYLAVDRAGFMVNPTNCARQVVATSVDPVEGPSAQLLTSFRVMGCARLPFDPSFTASTRAKASRTHGAELQIGLSYPLGDANVQSVAIRLPKQLPVELSTLQRACPEELFLADPRSCPVESEVGVGVAQTAIFANPLQGTTYLVSHGDRAFPDLVLVLEGEGVTVDLHGTTQIDGGAARATFSVPDVPITNFQLDFPQRQFPLFGVNLPAKSSGKLCSERLVLPTAIKAQSGAEVHQRTLIHARGCPSTHERTRRSFAFDKRIG